VSNGRDEEKKLVQPEREPATVPQADQETPAG